MPKFDESGLPDNAADRTVRAPEVAFGGVMAAMRASYQSEVGVLQRQLRRLQDQCLDTNAMRDAALMERDAAFAERDAAFAERDIALSQASEAVHTRDAVLGSTMWRATALIRRPLQSTPSGVKRLVRRLLKAVLWAATPWKMPARIRFLRNRNLLIAAQRVGLESEDQRKLVSEDPPKESPTSIPRVSRSRVFGDDGDAYGLWINTYESGETALPIETVHGLTPDQVCFSFLLIGSAIEAAVQTTLASLDAQLGSDWEVLIASSDPQPSVEGERRVFWAQCEPRADRGLVLADLFAKARGQWVAVLDAGDQLAADALVHVRQAVMQTPTAALIYSDEDEAEQDGRRHSPQFKPGWSPELLQAYNYFGRLTFISREIALSAGGFAAGAGAGAEWGLNLRVGDVALNAGLPVERIAKVLCHRAPGGDRDRPAPDTEAAAQHREVLRSFWQGRGIQAIVETQADGAQRSRWNISPAPLVSVIIPNRNKPDLLSRCLEGLFEQTTYSNIEVIIVENQSSDPEIWRLYEQYEQRDNVHVIRVDRTFNYSSACNRGAEMAKGSLLLFLNNDIEVVEPDWLEELVRTTMLPGVGVAGAKLLLPDGTLQHAGVGIGVHFIGLMYRDGDPEEWGIFGSVNHTRNWSAIMGACQMVRREVFNIIGGFDETFQIANSDIVLSLRALRVGWRTAYTPFAPLVHYEGMTRGYVNPDADLGRSSRELQKLGIVEDPYLHPQFSEASGVPCLRKPGELSMHDMLQKRIEDYIPVLPLPERLLDIFDSHEVEQAVGLPPVPILWPPFTSEQVIDASTAARWVIDLLRHRTDLRMRFPRALSEGAQGAFALWLTGEGGDQMGISERTRVHIEAAFAADPSARARNAYLFQDDARNAFPLGLLPSGRRNLAGWLFRYCADHDLQLEEVWWLLLQSAEDPAKELVRTYNFTPAWQEAHPFGLTIFGRDRFAAWLCDFYELYDHAEWLNPQEWQVALSPDQQIRLAYHAHDEWRTLHPNAFQTAADARALLAWLSSIDSGLPSDVRSWCALRLGDETADRLASLGANVIGHFCYPCGLRVSVEAMAEAIEDAQGLVARRNLRTDPGEDPHHADFAGLEPYDVTIIHTQPQPFFDQSYSRSDLIQRTPRPYRIGYWYWELDTVPGSWAEQAASLDEIWAATAFVADAIRKISPVPVRTLFPGVRIGAFTPRPRQAFGLRGREEGRFTFLFSFHMGSVVARKNPLGAIRAFRAAFSPTEPVDLVLKTTSLGRYESQIEELRNAAGDANITIIDRGMTSDENLSLMNSCDAYVSLHCSEGLGLTMAEAMLLGKPVIATNYSGNLSFMNTENSLLVDYALAPVGPGVPPYDQNARWAQPSVKHAAKLMRMLYDDQDYARKLGAKAQADAKARLSIAAAGRHFAERLAEIKAERGALRVKRFNPDTVKAS
jgi:GT2 family glycosyltransferase/glycosyltransferase involved in cell wall biosynthesis